MENWERFLPTGRFVGEPDAPFKIVEFADFQCPACRALHAHLKRLRAEFPGAIAVSYHYVPLPYHKRAYEAARVAECAGEQGAFERLHDVIYDSFDQLDTVTFARLAAEAKVPDLGAFRRCAARTDSLPRITRDLAVAMDTLKIGGTPATIINGKMYAFAPQYQELRKMIEEAHAARRRTATR